MNKRFCIYCGSAIAPDAVFCSACGKKQPVVDNYLDESPKSMPADEPAPILAPATQPRVSNAKASKFSLVNVIRNSVLLLVAIAMLIFAFCPLTSFEFTYFYSDFDLEINVSARDQVVLLFDSFKNLDDEEITETRLWEQCLEIGEFIEDNYDDEDDELSDYAERKISKFCFLLARLNAQGEDYSTPVMYYVSSAFSLIYIINAIALFIFALLNLLASLNRLGGAEASMYKWTIRALTLTPVLLIIASFNINIALSNNTNARLSDMAIGTLVLSISAIIAVFVLRMVFTKNKTRLCPVPRAIATTLAIVVICLSFAPVYTASIHTVFYENTKARTAKIDMGVEFFESFHLDETTKEDLEEKYESYTTEQKSSALSSIFNQFRYIKKTNVDGAEGNSLNNSILVNLLGMKISSGVIKIIPLISILFIGALIGAALILWQNLSYFANNQYSKKIVVAGEITSAICATLALTASIIFLVVIRNLDSYLPKGYDISIAAGVICLAIFAIGSVFCPHNVGPRVTKNNIEEPVVSYETTIE